MAEFDNNQSAIQYGESLLASREKERKKQRKRKKRIDRVNIALAGVSIADSFLTRNAKQKVQTFTNNLNADKAHALNNLKIAQAFKTNELDKLQQSNPGLDFNNSSSWTTGVNTEGQVTDAGAVFSALQKEYSENLRSKYGKGAEGSISGVEKDAYDREVLESTTRAFNSLKNKYLRFNPSLNTSEKLISNQYKNIIDEGTKQLLSSRNTSSIRKLLNKFGMTEAASNDLSNVELGGVNLYMNRELFTEQQERKNNIMDAKLAYEEKIKNMPLRDVAINTANLASNNSAADLVFKADYPKVNTRADGYTRQIGKGSDTSPNKVTVIYGPSRNVNTSLQDVEVNGVRVLSNLKAGTDEKPRTATYSNVLDSLVASGQLKDGMQQIDIRYKQYLKVAADLEYKNSTGVARKDIVLNEVVHADSLYKAITDLVTIGELESKSSLGKSRIFKINVMTVAEFQQSTDDPSVPINKKIAEDLKGKLVFKPTLKYPQGTFIKDGIASKPDEFKETFFREFNSRETEAEKRQFLEAFLQQSGPSAKTEINKLYDIITFGDSFDTSRSDYDSTPWMNSSKKKIIDRKINIEPTESFLKDVEDREDFRNKVYLDSLGIPTVGFGHKLVGEEKIKYKVGDRVPDNILNEWLVKDSKTAWLGALKQSEDLGIEDLDFIDSLASVNYQLGTSWFKIHKKTWKFLQNKEYAEAAVEAADSDWFKQTPTRVEDFQAAIRNL